MDIRLIVGLWLPASVSDAPLELFEHHGPERQEQVGKHAWIVSERVAPVSCSAGIASR